MVNHLPGGEIAVGAPGSPARLEAERRDRARLRKNLLKHYMADYRKDLRLNARKAIACMLQAQRKGGMPAVDGWGAPSSSREARAALVYVGRAIAAATDLDRIRERIADGEEN